MVASVLHWIVLVLIAVGSGLIIFGILKTSYAYNGPVRRALDAIARPARTAWRRLRRRTRVTTSLSTSWDTIGITSTARMEVVSGPPNGATDAERIDDLYRMFHQHEVNSNDSIESLHKVGDKDRAAARTAVEALSGRVDELRAELVTRLQENALDGLGVAAVGAVLVALGDILGAVLPLVGIV